MTASEEEMGRDGSNQGDMEEKAEINHRVMNSMRNAYGDRRAGDLWW